MQRGIRQQQAEVLLFTAGHFTDLHACCTFFCIFMIPDPRLPVNSPECLISYTFLKGFLIDFTPSFWYNQDSKAHRKEHFP